MRLITIEEINFKMCIEATTYANQINGLEEENRAKITYAINKINILCISIIECLFAALRTILNKLEATNTVPT